MAMPNRLVLVRHGQSEANVIQKLFKSDPTAVAPDGFFDRHDSLMRLTSEGREQARKAGEWLLANFPEGFDKYYVSPHMRTRETAGRLAVGGAWNLDDRWRERDWGEYGVLSDEERERMYEVSSRLKQQNKWYWGAPGGESLATGVRLRFEDILDTLNREGEGRDILAVTHGEMIDVARFVLERMTPELWLEQDKDDRFNVANCQIFEYSRQDPVSGEIAGRMSWMRSICPWDDSRSWFGGEWQSIGRQTFSDSELLAQVEAHPLLLGDQLHG